MTLPDANPDAFLRVVFGRDLSPEEVDGILWTPYELYTEWMGSRFIDPIFRYIPRAATPPLPWEGSGSGGGSLQKRRRRRRRQPSMYV